MARGEGRGRGREGGGRIESFRNCARDALDVDAGVGVVKGER